MAIPAFQEIHIENTNSCGYKCVMCPRDQQTRQIGYMPIDDFLTVLERIGSFNGNFHLHGFGEALLDRQFIKKIELLKQKFTSSRSQIFSTLGVRLQEDYFEKLITAGLSDLVVSLYGFTQESYKQVHGFDGFELVQKNLKRLSIAMKAKDTEFKARIKIPSAGIFSSLPLAQNCERVNFCKWIEDLGFEITEWAYVHNYGDGRSYNAPRQDRDCPVVSGKRKNILNITWDLHVIPCCYDFNATIRFGNLRKNTLEEIFLSEEYFNFILAQKLNHLANYPVCQNCEKNDYD